MVHYPKVPTPRDPLVGYLVPDGPAAKAGIHDGDQVVQIDDTVNPNWEEIALKEIANAHEPLQIWVMRNGERLHFTVTPAMDEKNGIGYLGWSQESEVEIADYIPGNDVAKNAGLQKGDILVSVNGQPIRSDSRLYEVIRQTKGAPVELVYSRHGQQHTVTLTPVKREVGGQERWMIGVQIQQRVEIVKLPLEAALRQSVHENAQSAKLLVQFLERLVERRMSPKALVGPVGIAQLSGEAAREGAATFISLMAMVSLNLAIFNLVPIPILDGGVMLMLLVEMLMRRDLDLKVKEAVVKVGFVFLMMVVVFVIYNDISKMLPPG
jgi:regulator of sigma E protease